MKAFKYIFGFVVIAAAVMAITSRSASATTSTCKIEPVIPITDVREPGKNFTFNSDGTVTAKFKVTGDANCKKYAVFAIWKSPTANGLPLDKQTFFDYAPKTATQYGPGQHSITVKLPTCTYYQLDLMEGTDPRGINGTANYGNLMHPVSNTSKAGYRRNLLDVKMGGQPCAPEKPKDVCPNIDGDQGEVPAGHEVDGNGNCVVPETPENPEEPETPQEPETPEIQGVQTPPSGKMPETGAAVVGAFFGVSTLAGLVHAIIRRFF